jgi:transcription-repair coupling factor (superfamily II helicase)
MWMAGVCAAAVAAQQAVAEPTLKAAFIVNFVKFATWPDDVLPANASIVLCTTDAEVAAALETQVANRTVNERALVVKRVKPNELLRGCSLLYTGRLDARRAKDLLTTLVGTNVLTVGEAEEFAAAGGMIGLFVDQGRMKFAVNLGAVERTRLRLSSQLLTLAKIIKG